MELNSNRYSVICRTDDPGDVNSFLEVINDDDSLQYINKRFVIAKDTLALLLDRLAEGKLDIIPEFDVGSDMKLTLYDYQKDVVRFGLEGNRDCVLISLPCGAGKTPMLISLFLDLRKQGKISADAKGMICVKNSIKLSWKREIEKFSDLKGCIIDTFKSTTSAIAGQITRLEKKRSELMRNARLNIEEIMKLEDRIAELEKQAEEKFAASFEPDCDLYIVNYETLRDDKVKKRFHKMKLEYVAADEIHMIKDPASLRSKALCEFSDVRYRAGASATPLKKNPVDVFGVAKFVSPSTFPSLTAFKNTYVTYNKFGGISGGKNMQQLNQELLKFMIVKEKEEIAKQLPKMVVITRTCQLEEKQQAVHEQLMEEIKELKDQEYELMKNHAGHPPAEELNKVQAGIMARQTFAQEIADTEELLTMSDSSMAKKYMTRTKKSNKIEMLLDLMEELLESGQDKIVIFSRYQRMQAILDREIRKRFAGIETAFVNGSLSSQQRDNEVMRFRDEEPCKVLLMSDAGAEGVSISWASVLIEMEPADSYLLQTQRRGRIQRADSIADTVYVYQLLAENSFDEIALKIVEKKEKYDATIIKGQLTEE